MRIIEKDLKNKTIEIEVEDTEDMWHLYNLIDIGDNVCGYTTREIRIAKGDGTEERCGRKRIYLCIEVEDVYFQSFTENLRIHGKIISCPDDIFIRGSYHTFSVKVGDRLKIIKKTWLSFHEERLSLAEKKERKNAIIITIDEENADIFLVKDYYLHHYMSIPSHISGKYLEDNKRSSERLKYLNNIAKEIMRLLEKEEYYVIIGGPGFTKNDLFSILKDKNIKVIIEEASSIGPAGAREILKRGALLKIFKESRLLRDIKLIDELLFRLAKKPNLITYGIEEVKRAVEQGAVDSLLISDKLFKKLNINEKLIIEEICKKVENYGGKVYFIGSEHEKGIQFFNLGGIAAFLRFPIS
ncbi:MAG: mRNA surveillance protein pelota [Candidatus Methanomethylicia archaeon]|jgi:protein pelota|nr:mRNA surveillance protein pelota [Candidatus Methanomethylicia archaeon]